MFAKYKAKLSSVLKPSIYLSTSVGFVFFLAILVKEEFQIEQKIIEASLMLSAVTLIFTLLIIGTATYFYKLIARPSECQVIISQTC